MITVKQYNLKLPEELAKVAESYAQRYGYRNLQDLAIDSLREKLFSSNSYDETFSESELLLIDKLIASDTLVDEAEIRTALRS